MVLLVHKRGVVGPVEELLRLLYYVYDILELTDECKRVELSVSALLSELGSDQCVIIVSAARVEHNACRLTVSHDLSVNAVMRVFELGTRFL